MKTSTTLALSLLSAAICLLAGTNLANAADANKPNIVLIVADDLGYGEIVCGGKQDIPTPNIHSLGTHGICFTNAYVSCPVCSPTRAGLMTGRYQQRFGHEFNPGPASLAEDAFGLSLEERTIAERLKQLGYTTGMVGKWHLGYRPEFHPRKRGFDEFYGFLGGAHSYEDSQADATNRIWRDNEQIEEKEYLTEAFGREATAFIERNKSKPFFLYLPFNATHAPLQAPEKYLARFSQIGDPKRRTFAAMLSAMDDAIGAVLEKLRAESLEENTLVFFIGDNGGPTPQISSKNDPLRGTKGTTLEGGIRVPFLVQWKGHLQAGKVEAAPVIALDILPTAAAAAGGSVKGGLPLDGVNLLPYLNGETKQLPHDKLYWRFGPQWAIRKGDLKLVQATDEPVKLFDLSKDIGEAHDLAAEKPEIAAELKKDHDAWSAELQEPKWQAAKAKGKGKGKNKAKANRKKKAAT